MYHLKQTNKQHRIMHRILRCTRAAAAVEFALIATPFMIAMLGLVDYGLMTFEKMELKSATRAGAQMALIGSTDTTTVKDTVVNSTNLGITAGDVTITQEFLCADGTGDSADSSVSCDNGAEVEFYITISATESYTPIFIQTTNITEETTMRISEAVP